MKNKKVVIGVIIAALALIVIAVIASGANTGAPQAASAPATQESSAGQATAEGSGETETKPIPATSRGKGDLAAYMDTDGVSKFGNAHLYKDGKKLLEADLEEINVEDGDTVWVSFLDQEMELPAVRSYSSIKAGGGLLHIDDDDVSLCINMGDFASTFFADKVIGDDDSLSWVYKKGIEGPIEVHIELALKGGADVIEALSYSDERSDYPNLTDEEFANFRMIEMGDIGKGTLYRTCSPVDPEHKRNTYADAAIKDAGVKTVVNLADTKELVESFEGYADSYYATTDYICLDMGMSPYVEDFSTKLAEGLRFMASHEGPYVIHCLEGKDRTGYVAEVLECLMGASLKEVEDDYMLTYRNYYGVEPGSETYESVMNNNLIPTLQLICETKDLESVDLPKAAEDYLTAIGLTDEEIDALKARLSKSCAEEGLQAAA